MPPLAGLMRQAVRLPRLARRGLEDAATSVAQDKANPLRLTPMGPKAGVHLANSDAANPTLLTLER